MNRASEKGGAFLYILIAIALFAALSFMLGRQEGGGQAETLNQDKAALLATELIGTASQVKSAIDQMSFAGTPPAEMDFTKPGDAGFEDADTANNLDKVYHPDGGGVTLQPLPDNAVAAGVSDAGWYLDRFNNAEWTPTDTNQDVMLSAYGLKEIVCQELNRTIAGSPDIPQLSGDTALDVFVKDGGANADLTGSNCSDCNEQPSLCVEGSGGEYVFYNILIGE